jgi:hypothetical protein
MGPVKILWGIWLLILELADRHRTPASHQQERDALHRLYLSRKGAAPKAQAAVADAIRGGNVHGMDSLDGGGLGSPTEPTGGLPSKLAQEARTRRGRVVPVLKRPGAMSEQPTPPPPRPDEGS